MQLLEFGLGIVRNENSNVAVGTGNLVVLGTDKKVYILTVAHIFTKEEKEYLLVRDNETLCKFRYANTASDDEKDGPVMIEIGKLTSK